MLGIRMTSNSHNKLAGGNSRCLDPSRPGELFSEVPMKQIDVSTPKYPNKFAFIDDEDFERLSRHRWHAGKECYTFYALSNIRIGKKIKRVRMHTFLMQAPNGMEVDHKDGDGLNNQRENLRICTHQQNMQNRRPRDNVSSKHKGVYWYGRDKKWRVKIHLSGQEIYLGSFADENKAGLAYDTKAKELFGEYARLNFPEGETNEKNM